MSETYQVQNPVAIIVFNRPDFVKRLLEKLKEVKPTKLYVIADAPRRKQEEERCNQVKELIENIDWSCQIFKEYANSNMGCRKRIVSGLDWLFSLEEEAIILEDDCIPDLSFFKYSDELLERYRETPEVMMISGTNLLNEITNKAQSYNFAKFGSIWGWATWKRAWIKYDMALEYWKKNLNDYQAFKNFLDFKEWNTLRYNWDAIVYDNYDTWDYQWDFCRFINKGLVINPCKNLVSNIGHGELGTHTRDEKSPYANFPVTSMNFSMQHPDKIENDFEFEKKYFDEMVSIKWWYRFKKDMKRVLQEFGILNKRT